MKKIVLLTHLFSFLFSYSSFPQEYSYTHYDINEGLAGSTVYCITQDKEGFIWAGTETGLSRFDGTHFKNFTAVDGLPDIEVVQLFCDSKGRVWMAPFRKSVCYYYKGKIYNQDNDSLLKKIHTKGNIDNFAEDRSGNILMQEKTSLHLLKANGLVEEYDSVNGHPVSDCLSISSSRAGNFLVQEQEEIYELVDKKFIPLLSIKFKNSHTTFIALSSRTLVWRENTLRYGVMSLLPAGSIDYFHFENEYYKHISFGIIADTLVYRNESSGSTEYNTLTRSTRHFLPGVEVSRVFRDDEGNTWFATLGQGIFRLNSDAFRNIDLFSSHSALCSVYSIKRVGNELFIGSNYDMLFGFILPDLKASGSYRLTTNELCKNLFIDENKNGDRICASDDRLLQTSPTFMLRSRVNLPIKACFRKKEDELLLVGATGAFVFDLKNFRIKDTIWHERGTCIYCRNDTYYIGTLNGLYQVNKDRSFIYLGAKDPFLKKRISAITESADSILWVATYDGGITGYRNGKAVASINHRNGLTSDLCRNLLVHNNFLWAGTDKGLNKIDLGRPDYPVTKYTSNDGLKSDIINTVYADGPMIYVGTSSGLSYFDESKTNTSAGCRLTLLGVINSGEDRSADSGYLRLPYTESNIRFEFAGISYKSTGNIYYKYRLKGLDSSWKNTKETFLEYPSLPSGNYEFELRAVNKFGVSSPPVSVRFVVAAPFWKTGWFYGLSFLTFLFLTWLFLTWRIRSLRRRQDEKDQLGKKMAEMERMALQAQMNPHFIFNCLNSIQQYIFDQDIFAANKYISGFAKLIRGTLQNSAQAHIPLADEIAYLSAYLSLEKLRFKEKMDYSIGVDPLVKSKEEDLQIPPMLIQPYVENSMRHGLRHKTDGQGHILIRFMFLEGKLAVLIEDNGVGREKAARYKTREHIEYQSKGMSLTADRIRLINSVYGDNITVNVTDLKDEEEQPSGTSVVIQFLNLTTA